MHMNMQKAAQQQRAQMMGSGSNYGIPVVGGDSESAIRRLGEPFQGYPNVSMDYSTLA